MPIDERRYPHFGGRKRPGVCAVCGRTLLVSEVDTPDDTGEKVCPACVTVAVDIAWDQYQDSRRAVPRLPARSRLFENIETPDE